MILDIQTITGGITLRDTNMFFTTTYYASSFSLHNTLQICVELDIELIIFDCRDTTINGVSYANSTDFRIALGL